MSSPFTRLRPEQILCWPMSMDGDGIRGRVLSVEFYGHDATARIALAADAGLEILARSLGHQLPAVGGEVLVGVEGIAVAYVVAAATVSVG